MCLDFAYEIRLRSGFLGGESSQFVRLLFVICAEMCPVPPCVAAARLPGAPSGSHAAQLAAFADSLDPSTLSSAPSERWL